MFSKQKIEETIIEVFDAVSHNIGVLFSRSAEQECQSYILVRSVQEY